MNSVRLAPVLLFGLLITPPPPANAQLTIDDEVLEVMGVDPIHFNSITELELLQKFVLFAEDELEFHDRAVVYPSSDENRLFWGDYVNIGSNATTDTVIAGNGGNNGTGIWLRGGTIDGDAALRGTIEYQNSAPPTGDLLQNQQIQMPALNWFSPEVVSFPSTVQPPIWINIVGGTFNASQNYYYGNLTVNSYQTLRLQGCGNYYFESLTVNSNADLEILNPDCETNIFVKQQMIWRGAIRVPEGETLDPENLLWGIFGTGDTFLETSLWGTVIAPNGRVVLACAKNLVGAIYAENIRIMQDARIIARNGAVDNVPVPGWFDYVRPTPASIYQRPKLYKPVSHECALDGFNITICYTNMPCIQETITWPEPYNRRGFPCTFIDNDYLVGETCSIVEIEGFPLDNISYWHINLFRHSASTYPYASDTQFISWYWWDATDEDWDGPTSQKWVNGVLVTSPNPWVTDLTAEPPVYWSGEIAGPSEDGAVWLWKNGFWAGNDIGCGPDPDTVSNMETWMEPDVWAPNPDAACHSLPNLNCWGDSSSAQSEFGYLPTGGLDFESGQRLVAFNYQCDVYCEEQSCGTPETVIFRIADQ